MTPTDDNNLNVPSAPEEDYSLEDILSEYGEGMEQRLLRSAASPPDAPEEARETPPEEIPEPTTPKNTPKPPPAEAAEPLPKEVSVPAEEAPAEARTAPAAVEEAPSPEPPAVSGPAPRSQSITLEDVVGSTVDAVMEERKETPPPKRRRRFFRKLRKKVKPLPPPGPEPKPEPAPKPIDPEPELWEAAHDARRHYMRRRYTLLLPLLTALPPTLLLILEQNQIKVAYWSGNRNVQCAVMLACLVLTALSCRHVFIKGFGMLLRRRCVSELLVSLSVLVSAADCALRLLGEQASDVTPYAPVTCLALVFAQWGVRRESKGNYDMLRAASVDDDPPYLVAGTRLGACKQRGSVPGFYTTAVRSDVSTLWQTALLPVFLAASVVFAVLSSVGQERSGDFLLNLSAILPAAATFSLPLCWALPWSRLSEHLQKAGCAVAGWCGAQKISARRRMIVTDTDLFPPGTVQLSGRKLFNETPEQAISLSASMARAAGSGLERLFNSLVRSEGGRYEKVDDFNFHEAGGWTGLIRGESVLMGSPAFMRKMNVKLPEDVKLQAGVLLAVDRELTAIFAVKYTSSENVGYALEMMRRSRIQPILASRDPNITPSLVRRKFSRNVHLEYPDLTERIALSEAEKDRDLPRALLFREGLLPYAEAVAGSLRLCKAVRRAAALSLLGSWAGVLLTFYLTSLGAYELLNPLALEAFLLLWTLPVLLISDWAKRY